jgi:sec-independent protein translocase protein TatA
MIGSTEIIIIGGIVLVLFGSAAIPKFFRSIGKAQREFEKGKHEGEEEQKSASTEKDAEPRSE